MPRSGPPSPFSLQEYFVTAEPVPRTPQQPPGPAAGPERSARSHSAISASQLRTQKAEPTGLQGQRRATRDSGWQQDLLKLVRKGLVTTL